MRENMVFRSGKRQHAVRQNLRKKGLDLFLKENFIAEEDVNTEPAIDRKFVIDNGNVFDFHIERTLYRCSKFLF